MTPCYSAELLLRQYKRLRDERKKKFRYDDIKPVYTIVLFEKSPREFYDFPDNYVHYIQPTSNTGIDMELLQKFCFIPLDIFRKCIHNRGVKIENELDAWLLFLCSDKPEDIVGIIERYPRFLPIYEDVYELCRNTEAVMGLFSKELQILDDNTVKFMIDDMQEEINRQNVALSQQRKTINQKNEALNQKDEEITKLLSQVKELQLQLATK